MSVQLTFLLGEGIKHSPSLSLHFLTASPQPPNQLYISKEPWNKTDLALVWGTNLSYSYWTKHTDFSILTIIDFTFRCMKLKPLFLILFKDKCQHSQHLCSEWGSNTLLPITPLLNSLSLSLSPQTTKPTLYLKTTWTKIDLAKVWGASVP